MTRPKNIIVTAANDLYLPLALGLLASLRAHSFARAFDIGVLDVGLGDEAKARLADYGAVIVTPEVDINYPGRAAWEASYTGYRAMTARPFLRRYFPGYDSYMWMDADSWAQTPEAIDTMMAGSGESDALHIASEFDRDYAPYFLSSQPWTYHFKWYSANFPAETVGAIFPRPMLNSGVFAARANSPFWQHWAEVYSDCLKRAQVMTRDNFMSDQLSLNIAVYMQGLPLKVMPAEFNWLSLYALPMWDEARNLFVRPTPPRTAISILHLTHKPKTRILDLATTGGGTITRSLLRD